MKSERFFMDEQTYADLNVHQTDKNYFSLYGLFKKTKILGGRERLEQMLRNPTNDFEEIKLRSDAIGSLMNMPIDLDITHSQADLILHYLKHEKDYHNGNLIDATVAYLKNKIRESPSYYTILIGIKQLIKLFVYSDELIIKLENSKSEYLIDIAGRLKSILEMPVLANVVKLSKKKKLRYFEIGRLDSIIRRKGKLVIIDLLHLFYELDVLEAVAKIAQRDGFCVATYHEGESLNIELEGLFYPGIKQAVRNNISLNPDQHCIFLTGSNMAGKSSFLRSLATSVYLAHLGFPVPAKRMTTTILNGLMTTINLGDDLNSGLSHYLNEVSRVRKIAELLNHQDKTLVLLDELFRGTNPEDGYTASGVVLKGFSQIKNSGFIVSSHLSQLACDLESANVAFKHLEHIMDEHGLRFTYKLEDGISREGIGMYFINREDIAGLLAQASNQ
ncbi:MutS-related protein [Pedobacter sp. PWIIR3]